ncbi:MAG: hypothetical protein PHD37_17755 [Gallionellaceae bacterium]|nr:hypothetical protein [Gallionellaceae bacterium]
MAYVIEDRVKETSTSTGTGNFTLAGAVSGFRAFSAICANNDTCDVCIDGGAEWEICEATWQTGGTLVRGAVIASSTGSAVNFSAGTKDVFLTFPAYDLKRFRPFAGSSAAGSAPLQFLAGALMTAAEAGAVEFDGKAFYLSPVARAVVAAMHLMSNSADFGGGNVNTAQPFFEAANDTITLEAATTYRIEGHIEMTRAAGTTSHTIDVLFGGTATVTDMSWQCLCRDGAASLTTPVRPYMNHFHAAAGGTVSVAATTVNSTVFAIKGMIRVNAGGTLIPQFKYSAAPGGAPTIKKSSFMTFTPVGSNTVGSIGPVA